MEINFNEKYKYISECKIIAEIVSNKEEKEYMNKYYIKVKLVNNNKSFKGTKLILYTLANDYKYGDIICIDGIFNMPEEARNENGFDYRQYLKQLNCYGIIKSNNDKKISENNSIMEQINNLNLKFSSILNKLYSSEISEVLNAILIGNKKGLTQENIEFFRKSSLAHILAISGLHINYIAEIIKRMLNKLINNKRIKDIFLILIIFLFCIFTGASPSCIRASIMIYFEIVADMLFKKVDKIYSILISLIIILFINPYYIENIGLWLSFGGIIGINVFGDFFKTKSKNKLINYFIINLNLTFKVQILIFPIILYSYNTISFNFIISNILVSFLILPIIVLGYLSILVGLINTNFSKYSFGFIENQITFILFKIAKFISKIKFSNIICKTPSLIALFTYYLILIFFLKEKIKFKNKIQKLIIFILIILILFFSPSIKTNKKLQIHFIDVGQGDCTLIITPNNKVVLIDGGNGANPPEYDYGEKVLVPYLLDKGILKIDYIIVSHFDSDHCGGLFSVLENLNVGKIIIGKQLEEYDNYKKFTKLANQKKVKLVDVEAGNRIKIDKNIYFDILWPDSKNMVIENGINNNSMVLKLCYNSFSMLFTGDIEQEAEKSILMEYKENIKVLNSTILKVAHHGSKTSSTQEFLNAVKPKLALIGVGKNNKFGHPNEEVIKKLNDIGCEILRTDSMGEISIIVDKIGNIKGKEFIKNICN